MKAATPAATPAATHATMPMGADTPMPPLPTTPVLLSRRAWGLWVALFLVAVVGVPVLHGLVPPTSPLHLGAYGVSLVGKFCCYALCALAMDLIWGFAGILSLGHSLFFALGGYVMGMHLMRQIGRDGQYQSDLPDFMVFLDWKTLPWHWQLSDSFLATVVLVPLVPGLIALVFGFFAFRSRIQGVYFSIITQALTYAAMLLFFRNETGFGGNNGFTDFKRLLGLSLATPGMRAALCALSAAVLLLAFLGARWLTRGRFGRVLLALRDAEPRLRFMGYQPLTYKLFLWTLSAMLCGVAGALYVPQVGIINPSEMSAANSIEIAVWAAVGGRGSLWGPMLGAFAVNGTKSWLTVLAPDMWLYVLGALFVAVTLFLPQGLAGLLGRLAAWRRGPRASSSDAGQPGGTP